MPITFQGAPYPADPFKFSYQSRRIIVNAAAGAVGTGATSRRSIPNGLFDGDLSSSALSGAYYRILLVNGTLTNTFDLGAIDLRGSWSLMYRTILTGNTGNSHFLFSVGGDATGGVPTTGINVGIEIPNATTARLWQCNNTTPVYSLSGALPTSIAPTIPLGDHFFWLDCVGSSNRLDLFCAFKPFGSVIPEKPRTPICSLSIPAAVTTGTNNTAVILRATATSPTVFTGLGLRDCVFTEY